MPTEAGADHADDASDEVRAELQRRWDEVLPGQPEIGAAIIQRYAEPHRSYHTQQHLLHVLEQVDELAGDQDLFLVRLAAFFHDAVYAIPRGQISNEEASARLARRELGRAGFEQEDLNEVARLVKLTADHWPRTRDPEGELLCDADLAILASEPTAYAAYVAQVRQEYAAVPEETFAAGRLEIMAQLLERELFRTARGRALSERARANVEAECHALAEQLGVVWPREDT